MQQCAFRWWQGQQQPRSNMKPATGRPQSLLLCHVHSEAAPAKAEAAAALHLYVYSAVRFQEQLRASSADSSAATAAAAPPAIRSGSPGSHCPPPGARCTGGTTAGTTAQVTPLVHLLVV